MSSEPLTEDKKFEDEPNSLSVTSSTTKSPTSHNLQQKRVSRSATNMTRLTETVNSEFLDSKAEETKLVMEAVISQTQEEILDNQIETVGMETPVVQGEATGLYTGTDASEEIGPNVDKETLKDTVDVGPLDQLEESQPVSSTCTQNKSGLSNSADMSNGHPEQSESLAADTDGKDQAKDGISEHSSNGAALVTLDEVCEEEDLGRADEAQSLKADDVPEALLTVDEFVGDDETGVEEYPLDKELQGLVTLDEIVDEEEEEFDSFNPEVSFLTCLDHVTCWSFLFMLTSPFFFLLDTCYPR